MSERPTEFFHTDVFPGDCFDDVGTGDKHLTGLVDHDYEVREGRRIHCTAGCGATHNRNLRNNTRGAGIALENLTVFPQRSYTLLDSGSAGIQDANHGDFCGQGKVHDLDDLVACHLAQRTTEHGEVLAKEGDLASMNSSHTGNDRVAVGAFGIHTKGCGAVANKFIKLDKGPLIEQKLDSLTGGQLAFGVLLLNSGVPACRNRFVVAGFEFRNPLRG